jgi:hypothetical protein
MEMASWSVFFQIVRGISSPNVLVLFRLCALLPFCPFWHSNLQLTLAAPFGREYQLDYGLLGCLGWQKAASIGCNVEEEDEPCGGVPCYKLGRAAMITLLYLLQTENSIERSCRACSEAANAMVIHPRFVLMERASKI